MPVEPIESDRNAATAISTAAQVVSWPGVASLPLSRAEPRV
jgi:hypothetical protein